MNQQATGAALAETHYERGGRLTDDEHKALTHNSRFGSDGYPVVKCGRGWTIDHPAAPGMPLYRTRRDAVRAWEILIEKWIHQLGLEAQARALTEVAA